MMYGEMQEQKTWGPMPMPAPGGACRPPVPVDETIEKGLHEVRVACNQYDGARERLLAARGMLIGALQDVEQRLAGGGIPSNQMMGGMDR